MNIKDLEGEKTPWYVTLAVGVALYVVMAICWLFLPYIIKVFRNIEHRWKPEKAEKKKKPQGQRKELKNLVDKQKEREDDTTAKKFTRDQDDEEEMRNKEGASKRKGLLNRLRGKYNDRSRILDPELGEMGAGNSREKPLYV